MMIPIIRVRDRNTGEIHILGTDDHDDLVKGSHDGDIAYYNLQNGDGSGSDAEDGYEFVIEHNNYGVPESAVEWISVEELQKRMKEDPEHYTSPREYDRLHPEEARQKRERLKAMVAELWKKEESSKAQRKDG